MKFNIKYPNLVEQAYNQLKKEGFSVTKAQVYKRMLNIGMIEKDGMPTQKALDNGLIESHKILLKCSKLNTLFFLLLMINISKLLMEL